MTELEEEILDMIKKGLTFSDYLGDGDYIEVCPLCRASLELGYEHGNDCYTTLLRKEHN